MAATATALEESSSAALRGFARRVGEARQARGLTQRELAFAAHTGQSHVIQLEGGSAGKVLITTVWKVSAALGVDPVWLAFGGGGVPEWRPVAYDELTVRTAFHRRAMYARKACGLTQRELADRLGIHQGNVSAIERGVQGATLQSLHGYVRALDLPPRWLMDTSEEIEPWR